MSGEESVDLTREYTNELHSFCCEILSRIGYVKKRRKIIDGVKQKGRGKLGWEKETVICYPWDKEAWFFTDKTKKTLVEKRKFLKLGYDPDIFKQERKKKDEEAKATVQAIGDSIREAFMRKEKQSDKSTEFVSILDDILNKKQK